MKKDMRKSGIAVIGILAGAGAAILLCLSTVAALASMILGGRIGEEVVSFFVPCILALSTLIGCLITGGLSGKTKRKEMLIATGGLVGIQWIVALMLDGKFQNAVINTVSVVVGYGISCLICMKKRKLRAGRKYISR